MHCATAGSQYGQLTSHCGRRKSTKCHSKHGQLPGVGPPATEVNFRPLSRVVPLPDGLSMAYNWELLNTY